MANIFKGYLPSKNKEPLAPIKGGTYLKEPPKDTDYVGILYEDIIQLDFDDEATTKKVLDIVNEYKLRCDILKTSRGIHLYFKDDKWVKSQSVGIYNAVGLKCDIGLGCKDRAVPIRATKEVEVMRIVDGEEVTTTTTKTTQREWLQTYAELEELPAFFRPIGKKDFDLPRSSTRNQTLFNYILTLQYHNFTRDEIRKTIKLINKHILYEPLTDKEIDVITRDEAFSEELFFEENRFLHDRFGNYMLTNCNIMIIDQLPHIYTDKNLYSSDPAEFERQMLHKIPSLKDSQRKEVYKYIFLKCTKTGEFCNPKYIGLKNSILDLETMEEFPYSPKWIINNRINYEYKEECYSELMDKTLDKVCCNDPEIRALLEEMIGYTLYRKNTMQSCFILTGEGSNGKSTILNCIKHLIGKGNYTSLDLRELEETFKPAQLHNKLANIGDDISAKYLDNSSIFKKVVTGESFIVQHKYAQPFELECYATQIFCANEIPQVRDKSDGFTRRLVVVPFNARFSKTDADYDPFIEEKLITDESLEYLLKIGIDGLKRVIINKGFSKSSESEAEKNDYIKLNNNIIEWMDNEPHIDNESTTDVYLQYQLWCSQNGCSAMKKMNLSKELNKRWGYITVVKKVNNKSVRVYVKEGEDTDE